MEQKLRVQTIDSGFRISSWNKENHCDDSYTNEKAMEPIQSDSSIVHLLLKRQFVELN